MIGVGLIDHPMGFIGKIRVNKELRSYFNQLVNYKVGDFTSRCGIVLRESGYSHICYIRPAVMMSNRLDIYKFKSKLANSTFKEKIRCLFDVRIFHPDILAEIYMYLTGKQISSSVFSLWVVFEQKYDADRSVTYDSGVTNINWFISDVEIENYKKSLVKLKKILSPAVRDIEIVESNLDDYLWSAAHHSGTVGIGTETGQVNEELLLNGFENVYVCDASIINEHSYSNTGLTIAQLSLDLCQRIINKSVNYL
jgi:choline dehydrogenase-like flavoprotein